MKGGFCYCPDFDEEMEEIFREAVFLGEGNNGIVYEIPGNKVLKIFKENKVCEDEKSILLKTQKSKNFPKVYKCGKYYILREKIEGIRLDDYIERHGMTFQLAKTLYRLLKEFKKLKFTKRDIRCKDLYLINDKHIRVIDPKKSYTRKVDYPRHLMKGLRRKGVLDEFLAYIEIIDRKKGREWREKINIYFQEIESKKNSGDIE